MPMLMPLYLPDLFAVRLQLSYGESASVDGRKDMPALREKAKQALHSLLREVSLRQVMGALRLLLSRGREAPLWLRQHVGRIMSRVVLHPGGVQATLEVYLAGLSGSGAQGAEGDETKASLRVAKLLAAPPKSVTAAEYVSRVAPQLADMLHYNGQQQAVVTR